MLYKLINPLSAIDARYHPEASDFSALVLVYYEFMIAVCVALHAILTEEATTLAALLVPVSVLAIYSYDRSYWSGNYTMSACFVTFATSVQVFASLMVTGLILNRVHASYWPVVIPGLIYPFALLRYNMRSSYGWAKFRRQSPTKINDKVEL